jgi:predicted  nucleic acid-binding Zn-ribbon protein
MKMPSQTTAQRIALLIGFMLYFTPSAFADLALDLEDYRSQKAALEAEIKRLDQRIKSTDSLAMEEKKRSQVLQDRYQTDLKRRRAELDSLQSNIRKQASELQNARNLQARAQSKSDNVKAYRNVLGKILAEMCGEFENLVTQTLPWDREDRVARIQALRRDLEAESAGAEEGFSRLRTLYAEEIRFGDEIAVSNRPITRMDGETVNARILRIGNQWMVYQDDEALRFGVLRRSIAPNGNTNYEWREDLGFEEKQAIKLAIDVKLARKPPQMVSLPLSLSISKTNEK